MRMDATVLQECKDGPPLGLLIIHHVHFLLWLAIVTIRMGPNLSHRLNREASCLPYSFGIPLVLARLVPEISWMFSCAACTRRRDLLIAMWVLLAAVMRHCSPNGAGGRVHVAAAQLLADILDASTQSRRFDLFVFRSGQEVV